MGKKWWFSAVKKVLSPDLKEKKDQKTQQSKKRWFGRHKSADSVTLSEEVVDAVPVRSQSIEEKKFVEEENEQNNHAYSVALASAAAAEAAVAAAQAAAEVVRLTTMSRYSGKSKEEIAAIKIQTAFRGYLARRALRALRGLVRLKLLVEGQSVKRQASTTLRCMQTLARVQSQIRARRIRMSEENQALQRQLQQKHEKELEQLRMGEIWDDSIQSKDQIEANLQHKQEAAMRRERALAYAFSHQTRKNSKSSNPTFMDPNNPHWGWSWLERWMAARPWEASSMTDKDQLNDRSPSSVAGETKIKPRSSPTASQRPSRAPSGQFLIPTPSSSRVAVVGRQQQHRSPKGILMNSWGGADGDDDDSKSTMSIQSEQRNRRRHSIAGSSVRDDESSSLASSPAAVPSYMAPTRSQSSRSKSKLVPSPAASGVHVTPEKGLPAAGGSVKKRLSFSGSQGGGPRRHSVPGKIESSPMKDGAAVHPEEGAGAGAGSG
ncbi:hypothetical protein Dimus_021174 [Dionaea muscipula]